MRTSYLLLALFVSLPALSEPLYPLNPRFETYLPNEAALVDQVRDGILFLQSKEYKAHGKMLRGTHSKGTCLAGELEVYDVEKSAPFVAHRLRKGMFSVAGKYATDIRFANAAGEINPDRDRDVRAVSLSVHMPQDLSNPQGLMDFTFNDSPTFPINNAQVFADLMNSLKNGFWKTGREIGLPRAFHVGEGIWQGKAIQEWWGTTPYQKLRYYSTVPFALGPDEAVKYSLKPCDDNPADRLNSSDRDELRHELIRHVNSDSKMACFEFQVQLMEPSRMTHGIWPAVSTEHPDYWVENAVVEWNEKEAPYYPVGRLTLKEKSIVDAKVCEKRWVSVNINNNETHHGLGSINRVRGEAEMASFKARSK